MKTTIDLPNDILERSKMDGVNLKKLSRLRFCFRNHECTRINTNLTKRQNCEYKEKKSNMLGSSLILVERCSMKELS